MNKNTVVLVGTLAVFLITLGILITLSEPTVEAPGRSDLVVITIENYKFTPNQISVTAGSTVTWLNQDPVSHNIVFDDQNASPLLEKGEQWSYKFDKPGSFRYYCHKHPLMIGNVEVR